MGILVNSHLADLKQNLIVQLLTQLAPSGQSEVSTV